jgi:hypothetical protein
MRTRLWPYVKVVTLVHVGIVGLIFLVSAWRSLWRRHEPMSLPVEFMVVAPEAPTVVEPMPAPEPEQPEPVPAEPGRERPRLVKPSEIQRSTRRVTRGPSQPAPAPPRTPTLTPEAIRRRLAEGAVVGDRNTPRPDRDALCLALVRQAFYRAWRQPSREEAGTDTARAAIALAEDGRVVSSRLVEASGNAVLDQSVRLALEGVARIEGVTRDFVARHPTLTIAFRVE